MRTTIFSNIFFASIFLTFSSSTALADRCKLSELVDKSKFLNIHNDRRAATGAAELTWDDNLASFAQCWADQCQFEHSHNEEYGENIAAGSGSSYTIVTSMNDWWNEYKQWSTNTDYTEATGHFTQMAWKDSSKLGCGVSRCNSGDLGLGGTIPDAIFVVCEYDPPGNVIGDFKGQVSLPDTDVIPKHYGTKSNKTPEKQKNGRGSDGSGPQREHSEGKQKSGIDRKENQHSNSPSSSIATNTMSPLENSLEKSFKGPGSSWHTSWWSSSDPQKDCEKGRGLGKRVRRHHVKHSY